jgi:hypothetical protein
MHGGLIRPAFNRRFRFRMKRERGDAIAIAGEFEVMNLSWEISWSWEV